MQDRSINLLTFHNDELAKSYLRMNGIKNAFVYKEDNRRWQVMEGDEAELSGFRSGEYHTKRAAKMVADKINERIKYLTAA